MRFHENEEMMDYITLFVSVLICFPEVGTIKYDREAKRIALTFILREAKKDKNGQSTDEVLDAIKKSLDGYHQFQNRQRAAFFYEVKQNAYEDYTVLEVVRDVATVTRAEISFLVELYRLHFLERLLMENVDPNIIDEYGWYDENRQDVFFDKNKLAFSDEAMGKQVLACRESGRVLVYSS